MSDLTIYIDQLQKCKNQGKLSFDGTKKWLSSALDIIKDICNAAQVKQNILSEYDNFIILSMTNQYV